MKPYLKLNIIVTSIFALTLLPNIAEAKKQHLSTSLAECAVIFGKLGDMAEEKNKPADSIEKLREGTKKFMEAAYEQGLKEGQKKSHIDIQLPGLMRKWNERLSNESPAKMIDLQKEKSQWTEYCSKLGEDKGFLPIE